MYVHNVMTRYRKKSSKNADPPKVVNVTTEGEVRYSNRSGELQVKEKPAKKKPKAPPTKTKPKVASGWWLQSQQRHTAVTHSCGLADLLWNLKQQICISDMSYVRI